MFSSNELLNFVFANDNDTYYCNELLAPDLNGFLWMKLHEQGYNRVYFAELEGEDFCIKTFGDRQGQAYIREKPKFSLLRSSKTKNNSFAKWLTKQLLAKDAERSAVIFSIRDFCEFFSAENWETLLGELVSDDRRTGTVVLTAPVEAEGSKSFFLNSPVFDYLRENGITRLRTANECDMYGVMHRSAPERMLYLNTFTAERIHCILTRLFLEEPRRMPDLTQRQIIGDYLLQVMNNAELRRKMRQRGEQLPSEDMLFRDLYVWLRRDENWNRLSAKAIQIADAGGVAEYLKSRDCAMAEDPVNTVCIRRTADSCAGRLMRMRLTADRYAETHELSAINDLLDGIRQRVSAPQNREENTRLLGVIEEFIANLQATDDSRDADTVRRILFAIDFLTKQLGAEQDSQQESAVLIVVDQLRNYINCSKMYHDRKWDLDRVRVDMLSGKSKLTAIAMGQLEDQVATAERMLSAYKDAVQASIVKLSTASAASITELAKSLSEELERQNEATVREIRRPFRKRSESKNKASQKQSKQETEPENALQFLQQTEPEQQPEPEPEPEEEEFILTDEDFDIHLHSR